MKSDIPKVLHGILGKPIVRHVIDSLKGAGFTDIITVAGYGSDLLKEEAKDTRVVIQKKLLGSADAVITAKSKIGKFSGDILIICGDTPLIKANTINSLLEKHRSSKAGLTILSARLQDPTGYGRMTAG